MVENKRGKFIVFEGIDGSGSTTQARFAGEYLRSKGILTNNTKEPTDNIAGGLIRGFLTHQWGSEMVKKYPIAVQLLFCVDRAHHLSWEIEPDLEKGKWVISDRYKFSTIAYGGAQVEENYKILSDVQKDFLLPDLTFFLSVDPKVTLERITARGSNKEYFEKHDFLVKTLEMYNKTFDEYRSNGGKVVEIKNSNILSIQEISECIKPYLDELVLNHNK